MRPRKDKRGVDLISDGVGQIHRACNQKLGVNISRSHDAVIRVYDAAGNMIETHEHEGDFKEWQNYFFVALHCVISDSC